jgi:hypothetical protein
MVAHTNNPNFHALWMRTDISLDLTSRSFYLYPILILFAADNSNKKITLLLLVGQEVSRARSLAIGRNPIAINCLVNPPVQRIVF